MPPVYKKIEDAMIAIFCVVLLAFFFGILRLDAVCVTAVTAAIILGTIEEDKKANMPKGEERDERS
jgi:hypothetical protein